MIMPISLAGIDDIKPIIYIFREGFPTSIQWRMNLYNRIWLSKAIHNLSCEIWISRENSEISGVLILVNNYREFLSLRDSYLMKLFYIFCLLSPKLLFHLPGVINERMNARRGKKLNLKYVTDNNTNHATSIGLDQIVISAKYRGKGIGSRLIRFAKKRAREKGFSTLSLVVNEKNKVAYQLYVKNGFTLN